MRDMDIRQQLHAEVERQHAAEPDTRIVDELGLRQGTARVDLAVVNGELRGYEIKSEVDTLRRLPRQVEVYGQVLDYVTLVTSDKHHKAGVSAIPKWWGVTLATTEKTTGRVLLTPLRDPEFNPGLDARALVELIWYDDAIKILRERNAARGVVGKPRRHAWDRLLEVLSLDEIRAAVRCLLKERGHQPTG